MRALLCSLRGWLSKKAWSFTVFEWYITKLRDTPMLLRRLNAADSISIRFQRLVAIHRLLHLCFCEKDVLFHCRRQPLTLLADRNLPTGSYFMRASFSDTLGLEAT
jgi:hypothetical protein